MIQPEYRAQVDLLLEILPYISKEDDLVLHGGTAINLFVRDMPRLSVDVDLTYRRWEDDRETAQKRISRCLDRITEQISKSNPRISITRVPVGQGQDAKLNCQSAWANVKIEVNTIARGVLLPPRLLQISEAVQHEFRKYVVLEVVSEAELFGGKACAALDRQHPRDLFDIYLFLKDKGRFKEIKPGFLFFLLGHARPMHELLRPNWQDRRLVFENQFRGMAQQNFDYKDHVNTGIVLEREINSCLGREDREFLKSFSTGEPDWGGSLFSSFKQYPAIQWKLQNIRQLATHNRKKHEMMVAQLSAILDF